MKGKIMTEKEWKDEEAVFECWECCGTGEVEVEVIVGGRYAGSNDPWQGIDSSVETCERCVGEGTIEYMDLAKGDDPWKLNLAH